MVKSNGECKTRKPVKATSIENAGMLFRSRSRLPGKIV